MNVGGKYVGEEFAKLVAHCGAFLDGANDVGEAVVAQDDIGCSLAMSVPAIPAGLTPLSVPVGRAYFTVVVAVAKSITGSPSPMNTVQSMVPMADGL